jgi:hypothetical protein
MKLIAGQRIVVESERVDRAPRAGVIEEILCPDPPCYRIHWDDGHTSILRPASGAAQVEAPRTARSRSTVGEGVS